MALLVFDTHDFITGLTKAGIDEEHAKAISDAMKSVELDKHVATKDDVASVSDRLDGLRVELLERFHHTDLKIESSTAGLRGDLSSLRAEMLSLHAKTLQWTIGMLLGQAALVAALVQLL